jgi:succinyl-diaminopimelate desuccinylase
VPIGNASWTYHPLGGVHADGRVFGRGASDMKSGLAAMLAGMTALSSAEVALPGVVVFAGVVGEEVDCCGSRHFPAENGMKDVGWLVVAEPTNPDLVVAHKGALRVELMTSGRAAHGSTPNIGVNAILHVVELLQRLTSLEQPHPPHTLLSAPTLSVNMIGGDFQINVVPDLLSRDDRHPHRPEPGSR